MIPLHASLPVEQLRIEPARSAITLAQHHAAAIMAAWSPSGRYSAIKAAMDAGVLPLATARQLLDDPDAFYDR